MKIVDAVEGGLMGTSTLTLLQEALHKIDNKAPRPLLHQSGVLKKIRKKNGKARSAKLYTRLASELLTNAAYFGLMAVGNKNNVVLRGGLLGAVAGLWQAFVRKKGKGKRKKRIGKKLYTLLLYTLAGVVAGEMVKHVPIKGKKGRPGMQKGENMQPEVVKTAKKGKLVSAILYIDNIPVGYEVHKKDATFYFQPTYSAKECSPPHFSVKKEADSWSFEPTTIEQSLKDQVVQEMEGMKTGKFLN